MSIEEAKAYYGEDVCELLIKIYDFCQKHGYSIYQHATNPADADNIMKIGFVSTGNKIKSIPSEVLQNKPIACEVSEEGVKTTLYDGGQAPRLEKVIVEDVLSSRQHFFENKDCKLNFDDLTDPVINRSGFGATCIFVVSNDFRGSREYKQYGVVEAHYDDDDDVEVPETYFERMVVPKQLCIGYLDVDNRKFVVNPDFQFNYGVADKFLLGTTTTMQRDLEIELNNSVGRKI